MSRASKRGNQSLKVKYPKTIDNNDKITPKTDNELTSLSESKHFHQISDEELSDLYLEMLSELQTYYGEDAMKHHKVDDAETTVNEVWAKCNKGEASLSHFKDAMASFREIYAEISDRNNTSETLVAEESENNLCRKCLTNDWERVCWGTNAGGKNGFNKFCLGCRPY